MKKRTFIIILSLLVSCTSNTIYEKPTNLIPKDTMVLLLSDMFIASAAKPIKNLNLEKKVNYMDLVYIKYKIDTVRFKESNFYYTTRVEEYEKMLFEVKTNIEKKRDSIQKIINRRDSIKRDSLKKLAPKTIDLNKLKNKVN